MATPTTDRNAGDIEPTWTAERVVAPDGTPLAAYRQAVEGDGTDAVDLLLVHATGFCAAVFDPLVAALPPGFRCVTLDLRFHGASGRPDPVTYDWSGFAADVLATVDQLGLDHPVAFGHSCGGASLILAEEHRPGTFAALYCFEPVIMPSDEPRPPEVEGNPLATGALRRRESFASASDAFANFSSKPPFDTLDPAALRAYVEHGFELIPDSEGGDGEAVRLRCRREDESQIYAHGGSHDAFLHLGSVACPVTLVCGATTDAFGPDVLAADAARLPQASIQVLDAMGHFGPLEAPATVARSVAAALAGHEPSGRGGAAIAPPAS